jgi:pyocin large subunit-like protein
MRRVGVLVAAVLAAALVTVLMPRPLHHAPPTSQALATQPAPARPDIGFRTPERLAEHYRKHGREFGNIDVDHYLRLAQELRDRPAGGMVLESVRDDGVTVRFDRASGAFIAFDRDGAIRTFFRPDRGEAYYRSQMERGH